MASDVFLACSELERRLPAWLGSPIFLWKIMSDWMKICPDAVISMPAGFISHYIIYITG